ncbi:MAG: tetratricopeptide repeat protein [Clostridiales Family XIII bacterium]|jgi:tetratricopeptide (TPR) repeat protein|nr:tetratricopeptide repeat protein [Clostridiales Family XIII bacterium]
MAKLKRLNIKNNERRLVSVSTAEREAILDQGSKSERDKVARQNAKSRPESERSLRRRPDRIKKYVIKYLDDYIFDEFSDTYLKKAGIAEFMKDVPIPLRREDLEGFKSEKGLSVNILAEGMVRIIGIDPNFRYTDAYLKYIEKMLGKKSYEFLTKEGRREAAKGEYDAALIHYRAALVIKSDDMAAMYGYARTCRALYNEGEDETYIGEFKAEALEYFEMLTELHPRYGQGWYYLGYLYLNMGLYTKAYLAWESFLPKARAQKDRREIKHRMEQIRKPMEIERGYNAVLSGRWQEGIIILEPFTGSVYKDWWPLWYYLGESYLNTDRTDEAEDAFKKAIRLNASHIESMESLIEIYSSQGKQELVNKYVNKIKLVKSQLK